MNLVILVILGDYVITNILSHELRNLVSGFPSKLDILYRNRCRNEISTTLFFPILKICPRIRKTNKNT